MSTEEEKDEYLYAGNVKVQKIFFQRYKTLLISKKNVIKC